MIIDSHHHVFPPLWEASGYPTAQDHLDYLRTISCYPNEPARRASDRAIVEHSTLWDESIPGPRGFTNASLRMGPFGRIEWSYQGIDYYVQFLPPSREQSASPPEYVLAEMTHAGVDMVVLQNAHAYGRLNDYFSACARQYPGKFIPLADVDEITADTEEEIESLRYSVESLGCRGLYYASRTFFFAGGSKGLDDARYDPLWQEVRRLGISMWWEIAPVRLRPTPENYLAEVRRLNRWLERYPDIPCVLTHGIAQRYLGDGSRSIPVEIEALLDHPSLIIEMLYPINVGWYLDYPYVELHPTIRMLHSRVGAQRLVWGSDMPNAGRNCTYRQSLDYLRRYCDFIPPADMDLILGENLRRLFAL